MCNTLRAVSHHCVYFLPFHIKRRDDHLPIARAKSSSLHQACVYCILLPRRTLSVVAHTKSKWQYYFVSNGTKCLAFFLNIFFFFFVTSRTAIYSIWFFIVCLPDISFVWTARAEQNALSSHNQACSLMCMCLAAIGEIGMKEKRKIHLKLFAKCLLYSHFLSASARTSMCTKRIWVLICNGFNSIIIIIIISSV